MTAIMVFGFLTALLIVSAADTAVKAGRAQKNRAVLHRERRHKESVARFFCDGE